MLQGRWGTLDDVIKYNCGIVFAHAEKNLEFRVCRMASTGCCCMLSIIVSASFMLKA
jgi:hypothetical protein